MQKYATRLSNLPNLLIFTELLFNIELLKNVLGDVMHIVRESDKCCCTCAFWTGARTRGEDGFIYSLLELEGLCRRSRSGEDAPAVRGATSPNAVCGGWLVAAGIA